MPAVTGRDRYRAVGGAGADSPGNISNNFLLGFVINGVAVLAP